MRLRTIRAQILFTRQKQNRSQGFTIVEVLLSLALMAMIMTAAAFAFDASVKNYQANDGIYKTINTARQALLRITNDLRTADEVATEADDSPNQNTQVSMLTGSGNNITYRYDTSDNILYYDDNTTSNSYVLCRNVTDMTFNRSPVPDDATQVRSVRIIMTVTDEAGKVTQTLAAASVVRRNM
jgi:prepilin-type N-terminal cleavage/methylation domain-containing protein